MYSMRVMDITKKIMYIIIYLFHFGKSIIIMNMIDTPARQ